MRNLKRPVVAAIILVAAVLGAILYTSLAPGNSKYRVEVCMAFEGRTECRKVRAATHNEALRTATDGACSMTASGQADLERCRNTPPVSEKWF